MSDFEYDLVVIGSGPAGQRAAIQGVKLRKRVAIIERKSQVGLTRRSFGRCREVSGSVNSIRRCPMAVVKRFEDLIAWQEARKLSSAINSMTRSGSLERDYALRDQLRRAALSVMTNIAEGFDCESRTEFARFLVIARRSAVEVQSLLYSALDDGHISHDTFQTHYEHTGRTRYLINRLRYSMTTTKTPSDTSRHLKTPVSTNP
jgi:four helix bundle protein